MKMHSFDSSLSLSKNQSCSEYPQFSLSECGRVFCFGWNAHGQLGLGDTVLRDSPTELKYFDRDIPVQEAPEHGEGDTVLRDSQCKQQQRARMVVDVFAGAWNSVFIVETHRNTGVSPTSR